MTEHKITFTLAEIRKHSPCADGWKRLNKTLGADYGDDKPITIEQIIESNDINDALWCLRATPTKTYSLWRHFAIDCANQVKHLMSDIRSTNALDVAKKHADGLATDEELSAAAADADAAYAAAADADAAYAAAAAAYAAYAAAAAYAADAYAYAYAKRSQSKLLIEYCRTGERVLNPERFFK